MQHCDTLIFPRWCVPIEPENTVHEDWAVALSDGRISAILPAAEARESFQASVTIERPQHVLLPGLINTHTHAAMTLFRGFAEDMPLESWLRQRIWPAEQQWVSPELVRDGTALAIAEMLLSGTTCFADQYFFPEIVAETAASLHMRATVGTPVVDFPTAWSKNASDCLAKGADLVHDPYADHPLISSAFAPHSTYAVSDAGFSELRIQADQLDVRVQIHLHETATEVSDAVARTGKRPLRRLQDLGLVNSSLLAVHAVHLEQDEIELLAETGASVAHCPKSNLKLASGMAPVAELRAAGVNVGIGTDSAAGNNTLDMLDELRFALLLSKSLAGDPAVATALQGLRMATLDGARALGLERQTGSLLAGKAADLICVDLDHINSQPVYEPAAQVVYTAKASQVSDVWVAGRQLLDQHTLTEIDCGQLLARGQEWQARIASAV